MIFTNKDFEIGDVIEYRTFGGDLRIIIVEGKDDDVKNGRPGFDGRLVNEKSGQSGGVWGYTEDITRIVCKQNGKA
jgi:hypothetical protein